MRDALLTLFRALDSAQEAARDGLNEQFTSEGSSRHGWRPGFGLSPSLHFRARTQTSSQHGDNDSAKARRDTWRLGRPLHAWRRREGWMAGQRRNSMVIWTRGVSIGIARCNNRS